MAKEKKEVKTNVMRILEKEKIPYEHQSYECDDFIDGIHTADMLGLPHEKVYKTLVTQGTSKNYFVFVIPIAEELDMKKAAKSVGEKSVSMIPVKDITAVTGYIRGGCSPLGAKKNYPVYMDASCNNWPEIAISAGQRGMQIVAAPADLQRATKATVVPLIFA